jgi:hypothetical protein
MDFCGAQLELEKNGDYKITNGDYTRKLKPITIEKSRNAKDPITIHERKSLKGLLGSLAWPSNQTSPHLQCSVSLLQGQSGEGATVEVLQDVNKLLKFAKANDDVGITVKKIASKLEDFIFVVLTDAAWAVRHDGTSQGGYLIVLTNRKVLNDQSSEYIVLDWRSCKLPRVSRSSLSCEAQAATMGVDALELVKVYWSLLIDSTRDPTDDYTMQCIGDSALVIDAKALYDAAQKEQLHSFNDKRTGIEVMVLRERMRASSTCWRWVSSERQYADGLTKYAARQLLADRLRKAVISLYYDKDFVAAKKKTREERHIQETMDTTTRSKENTKGNTQSKKKDQVKSTGSIRFVETALTAATCACCAHSAGAEYDLVEVEMAKCYESQGVIVKEKLDTASETPNLYLTLIAAIMVVTYFIFKFYVRCWRYLCTKDATTQSNQFEIQTYKVRDFSANACVHYDGTRYWHQTQGFFDAWKFYHGDSRRRVRIFETKLENE